MGLPTPSITSCHNSLPNYLPRNTWSLKMKWKLEPLISDAVGVYCTKMFFFPQSGEHLKSVGISSKGGDQLRVCDHFLFCVLHTLWPTQGIFRKFGVRYIEFKYVNSNFSYCAESACQWQLRMEMGEVVPPTEGRWHRENGDSSLTAKKLLANCLVSSASALLHG